MQSCFGFKYPKSDKNTITDVSIYCTLSSRVVVHGANGAGKSTMIKVLTGETEATEGTCWKHPNLRIAYVAQHAFHHLEQHLDKTPNQYIQWRYASGEDREALLKVDRLTEEEEAALGLVERDLADDLVEALAEELLPDGADARLAGLSLHKLLVQELSEAGDVHTGGILVAHVLDVVLAGLDPLSGGKDGVQDVLGAGLGLHGWQLGLLLGGYKSSLMMPIQLIS